MNPISCKCDLIFGASSVTFCDSGNSNQTPPILNHYLAFYFSYIPIVCFFYTCRRVRFNLFNVNKEKAKVMNIETIKYGYINYQHFINIITTSIRRKQHAMHIETIKYGYINYHHVSILVTSSIRRKQHAYRN